MRKIKYKGKTPLDMKGAPLWRRGNPETGGWLVIQKQKLSAICLVLLLLQGDGGGLLQVRDELVLVLLGDGATASMC